jgi:hypothetical protein
MGKAADLVEQVVHETLDMEPKRIGEAGRV